MPTQETLMKERPLPEWLLTLEAKKRAKHAKNAGRKDVAAKKTVAEKDYVDANNRKMGWKTFATLEAEAAERLRRERAKRPESPRAFPYEVLQTDIFEDAPVATFAKMHGTHRNFKAPDATQPSFYDDSDALLPLPPDPLDADVEAMRQPDAFLRLDQAQLPIETFDSQEFEEIDKSPEEWMATAKPGKDGKDPFVPGFCAYFVQNAKGASGGTWRWRKAKIVAYDSSLKQFKVKMGQKERMAARLNLRFAEEDEAAWNRRRAAAHALREEAKQALRLDYFVSEQPASSVRAIAQTTLKGIHGRVNDGLLMPFPQPGTESGALLRNLTADVIQAYARAMKTTIIRRKYTNEPEFKRDFIRLKLPQHTVAPRKPPPEIGGVQIPPHAYDEHRAHIQANHLSSHKAVLDSFVWLATQWEKVLHSRFVLVPDVTAALDRIKQRKQIRYGQQEEEEEVETLSKLVNGGDTREGGLPFTLPCVLEDFVAVQHDHCAALGEKLQGDWRQAFVEQVVDSCQDVFDFFQSKPEAYNAGSLKRLLKHFEVRMTQQLREILSLSVEDWVRFVERFCEGGESKEGRSVPSLFQASLDVTFETDNVSTDGRGGSSRSARPERPTPKVTLSPSPEDLEFALLARIDEPIRLVSELKTCDASLMSLLHLPARTLLNVKNNDELCSDIDGTVDQAGDDVRRLLKQALEAPRALAEAYGAYAWVAATDPAQHVKQFAKQADRAVAAAEAERVQAQECVAATKPEELEAAEEALAALPPSRIANDAAWVSEVKKFHDAAEAVETLSEDAEAFALLHIDCTSCKIHLAEKARAVREALLKHILDTTREENKATIERYEEILAKMSTKPKDEGELAFLKQFIADTKEEVFTIMSNVEAMQNRLASFHAYGITISKDDTFLAYSCMEYPKRVLDTSQDLENRIEMDKIKMIDKLAFEKNDFDGVVSQFAEKVRRAQSFEDYSKEQEYVEAVNGIQNEILDAKATAKKFNMREEVFGFPPTEFIELDAAEEELAPYFELWNMISDYHANLHEYLNGNFMELDGPKIKKEVDSWWKGSYKLKAALEEDCPEAAECAQALRDETALFKKKLPIIEALANPALKDRHWERLSDKLGTPIVPYDEATGTELTLQFLLDLNIVERLDDVQEITVSADKEYKLERGLSDMKDEWAEIAFEVKAYKETGTSIVGGVDEIIALLDDHIVKTQTMCGSMYIKAIEGEARGWESQLKYAQNLVDEWIAMQRVWMYLEPIFGSEDIMRQLPTEARRFNDVDKLWRSTMKATEEDPVFISQAEPSKSLVTKMQGANEKLDKIQKGLSDYLEMKRLYFPRFFFLADEQMLEILSDSKDPKAVQPHLGKCFEGLNTIKFEKDLKITQMISPEGERVDLVTPIDPESGANKGNVEKWLLELESLQWVSVRKQVELSLQDYPKQKRIDWCISWPAQAILAVSQIFWTEATEKAIDKGGHAELDKYILDLNQGLTDIVMLVRGALSKLQRKTLSALVVMDIHSRDTCVTMVTGLIEKCSDFQWQSQMRYYWGPAWKDGQAVKKGEGTVVAKIINARCLYGYEYLGNSMRLVVTPLTDRCYRTMISAIDLLYGGAPEGPAGTGKTETVKDLSKAISIQCVVFNCSDQLDYKAMAKFFKGLAGCGSWCCFDEFNRISVEVLSVVAQQILTINKGKASGNDKFTFEGTFMKLNTNANPFITMNPGYAGRAELPDNLKALFRPCAMMVPDYGLIGEIRLYSFGFEAARVNAQKLVRTLQLCSEQCSSQKHYDYGMRAVNSILVACGNLRLKVGDDPLWDEAKVVLRSVMDVNLPKFTVADVPLFLGITADLFPGVELPTADHGALIPTIDEMCWSGVNVAPGRCPKLEPKSTFTLKIVQLYEMVLVRHGVMIVGETCSGKTASIHCLANAMTTCAERGEPFEKVIIYTMNPKSINAGQLYGNFDDNTHEWSDGVLAVIFRNTAMDTGKARQWVVFDGPVDAVWIENMNTVLDDNKKLCLMSGEIIKMTDRMSMMFEAEDLEEASPATVSRVGMIFCESTNIGWEPFLQVWCEALEEPWKEHASLVRELYGWLFPPLTYFVEKFCKTPCPVTLHEQMRNSLKLLSCFMRECDASNTIGSDVARTVEGLFLMATTWSVGAAVDQAGREKFDGFLRLLLEGDANKVDGNSEYKDFKAKTPGYHNPGRQSTLAPPSDAGVHDFRFVGKSGSWSSWVEPNARFVIPKEAQFNAILVPTLDTIRNEYLIAQLLHGGANVLCVGDTGTGKSVGIKNHPLMGALEENFCNIQLNFSAQTQSNQVQDIIDSKLDKRRKGVLGPPLGKQCIIFVDDLNMPAKEEYGAQPPVEILRQWMDHAGWYNREENSYVQLVDIQFVAAMGPPGGGRTFITQRYVRHYNLLNFVPFSEESLTRVFSTIMDWALGKGYPNPVKQLSGSVVEATIKIYDTIAAGLLPTPMKSHYTFNLRDMAKVFQGLTQGTPKEICDKGVFVSLWCHEAMRVFHDRLINDHDRDWFVEKLGETCKDTFSLDFQSKVCVKNLPLMFGSYLDYQQMPEKRAYKKIMEEELLQESMDYFLKDYNQNSGSRMALVLFLNAMEHVSRIARIISQPYGNALLMGVGGSGRKSLTTLAVYVCDFKLCQISVGKAYGKTEWGEDLKRIMSSAGAEDGEGVPTVFLFDDTQIVYESFLEDVNLLLNTGEVPNLFVQEDLSVINDLLGPAANEAGVNTGVMAEMYKYFISRCRSNLHVVLTMSPIGDDFRRRLRMFPALVNCCTLDWFTAWPEQALRSVASYFLGSVEIEEEVKKGVVDVCVDMQERVSEMSVKYVAEMQRHYYVTPTSYLALINTFKKLLDKQRNDVMERKLRYDNGLEKILSTEAQVDGMQTELVALQPKLKQATIETDALLDKIAIDTKDANEVAAVVSKERAACNQQAAEATKIATDCQADLDKAMPALQGAIKALDSLSKGDIVEVKAMKKPPDAVKLVMEAVCLMMNVKPDKIKDPNGGTKKIDDYWGPAQKQLLGDSRFLQNLKDYDKDHMDEKMVVKVNGYCEMEMFTVEVVQKASKAAAGLCKWVSAMMVYDSVAKNVGPKKAKLLEAQTSLKEASEALAGKEATLKAVQDKLAELQAGLDAANKKKGDLQASVKKCATQLERAEQLIKGLGGEKARWSELSQELGALYVNVTGDILLSSGVIAYLGAFVVSYREDALQGWKSLLTEKNIPSTKGFTLRSTLGEEVNIREWVINKLPNDEFSVENAIMLERSDRWPLMIDPQGQANKWIKKTYGETLKVVKLNQSTFARTIENAIPFGTPVLIENVGEVLDPVLEPVLLKQVVVRGGSKTLKFGDGEIEYDDTFRMFITSKLRNPHYPPELCVKVNLLNFMATVEGLEDQMLGLAVACEEAALEAQREQLVLEDAENKKSLKEIEDQILYLLKNSEGNILDDEVLIETLKNSKIKSVLIEKKVKAAAKTSMVIAKTRKGYKSLAFHGSQLFFCIADLSVIDPMYQYSMEWYQALFVDAMEKADAAPTLEERLENLKNCFTYVLYLNVCRSLFEKDKLLFSFLLTVKIMSGQGQLDSSHLRFLLAGNTAMDRERPLPATDWLTDKCWGDVLAIGHLPGFEGFVDKFLNQLEQWQGIYDSKQPMVDIHALVGPPLGRGDPDPRAVYTAFQHLCLLRAIRPDAVVPEVQAFVKDEMGAKFIEVPQFDLGACYADSKCYTPLLFVLTPGADPMSALFALAEEEGFGGKKLHAISLGQGQGDIAYAAISEAQDKGTWVCLQNCHLCISWMPTLERLCEELSPDRINENFRLWLTSEPSPHFPAFILQNGIKMTIEPPKGVRANLIGSYTQVITEDFIEGIARGAEFKKMLFGLCFFHAIVRERRKYGPLGWNMKYVFSGTDLKISLDQLRIMFDNLEETADAPYAALRYLTGECNYGGRVTDGQDRRCLANMLTDFYSEAIQQDTYKFSPSGTYYAPAEGPLESYAEYVNALPYTEGPELFGLHDNANITCALGETNLLLDTVLSLQPRSSGGAGKSWDDELAEVSADIEARLPPAYDIELALIQFPVRYDEAMNTVLTQELQRFNNLTIMIEGQLKEVQRALKGLVVMSGDLEAMGNSMVTGRVPGVWSKAAYPSRKPLGSWTLDLIERLKFLQDWFDALTAPNTFWISGFFFTQAFITGTLQNYARKYKLPIDQVAFDYAILRPDEEAKALAEKTPDGSVCRGLFLEGARWDIENHVIAESRARELYTTVPMFHMIPKLKGDITEVIGRPELYTGTLSGTAHDYQVPVYKESARAGVLSTTGHSTNFVMFIRAPMAAEHTQQYWIKRGVAMLSQLDD